MLRPSGPLRLCRRAAKAAIFALSSNGPSTRPPQGHTLADLPVGTVLRVKGPPAINRFSVSRPVSKTAPRSPRFPQAASTSSRRKRSINQFYSRFLSATCPQSLEALCRVNAVPTSGLLRPCRDPCPRSIPRSAFIPPHHHASPTLRCRYPPGPSIQSRSCGCNPPRFPARVATPCRRIRRISCRHRLAIAYSAALAAGGAFFVSTNSSSFLSRPDDKKTLQTPRLPEIVKHQELGPAKHTSFATSELPATFTASLQTLPSTGYPSG